MENTTMTFSEALQQLIDGEGNYAYREVWEDSGLKYVHYCIFFVKETGDLVHAGYYSSKKVVNRYFDKESGVEVDEYKALPYVKEDGTSDTFHITTDTSYFNKMSGVIKAYKLTKEDAMATDWVVSEGLEYYEGGYYIQGKKDING